MAAPRKHALPAMPVDGCEHASRKARKRSVRAVARARGPILDVEGTPVPSPKDTGTTTALVQVVDRGPNGRFAPGNSIASLGGRARRGQVRMVESMGLRPLEDSAFSKHRRSAQALRLQFERQFRAEYELGEHLPPTASAFLAAACLQYAWALTFSDQAAAAGQPELATKASQLLDRHRIGVDAARDECKRARAYEDAREREREEEELRRKVEARRAEDAKLTPEERRARWVREQFKEPWE